MAEKIKLFDTSKCTGCRGCQLACKQWNQLPARQTRPRGTYQNPPDLQWNTFLLMRFQEMADAKGGVKWFYRHNACMHCTDAACVTVCPSGALYYTDMKTVGLNRAKCIGCKECISACPFDIPRYDEKADKITKCDMCESRLGNNLEPACAKACPTGALLWGDKDRLVKAAYKRAKDLGGDANVYGDKYVNGTHLVYVLQEKEKVYDELPTNPSVPLSIVLWKDVLKPLSLLAAGGVLAGSFLHYVLHGPKSPDENGTEKKEGGE
ncbi:MAG: 4Fe-4S dicluster domain-containing protein [Deltaproteobacteria bacterium]|nr:4Fe-4S dicluster domain-containing protein [Deltaproteobacteria bacterium]